MPLLKEFDLITSGSKEKIRAFQLQTRCVTALYQRLFPKFKTKDCWKVLVRCVNDAPKTQYRNIGGVCEPYVVADVEGFFLLDDAEKRVWAFEHLKLGVTALLKQTGWETEPFMETFNKAEQLKLYNVWLWKAVHSPSRKLIAEIWIDHDVQSCVISLVVRERSGKVIKRQQLITELPSEWAFARYLGSLSWESEARVVLKNKEMNQTWRLELKDLL